MKEIIWTDALLYTWAGFCKEKQKKGIPLHIILQSFKAMCWDGYFDNEQKNDIGAFNITAHQTIDEEVKSYCQ